MPHRPAEPNIYKYPAEILKNLIRFDTTNPPGNEAECIAYINSLLTNAGFETTILAKTPSRTNLITRLKGQGNAPPLLLYGHVDVVTTAGQAWTHPPFEAELADGCVWGRGALDMKGAIAMMLSALLRAKAEGLSPAGDIVLAILSDEESGGAFGARYLVENHPGLFKGVRYALGEFGGARIYLRGRKLYPIMVSEKQICWMKATVRGPGGHGSLPMRGGAMARLSNLLRRLEKRRMPVHITPAARQMVQGMASAFSFPVSPILRQLLNPVLTDTVLNLLGPAAKGLEPVFHNTVNATVVRGGEKINVIPSEIVLELDGRLLPGFKPDDMISELRGIIGKDVELELLHHDPGPMEPDLSLFDMLAGILRDADPGAQPFPTLLPGVTDGRHFAALGIQTYGFTPMNSPEGIDLLRSAHGADERIPLECLEFGMNALYKALQLYRA